MNVLDHIINGISLMPSDINEHVGALIKYSKECPHITEMGVRAIVSTWVFLYTKPKTLISYDLENPSHWDADIQPVYDISKRFNVNYKFIQADVRHVDIENTDLLFLDTWHVYDQVKIELTRHSPNVNKYIILHDTTLFDTIGETGGYVGIWPAIAEFISENKNTWIIHERYMNNNGLTVLKRIS